MHFCSCTKSILLNSLIVCLVFEVYCDLKFEYHTNEELETILKGFEQRGRKNLTTKLYSIGNSSSIGKPFPLWVLEITAANPNQIGIPNVKLLGNMHGNEAGGREILLHFIEFLISEYGQDKNVTWLLKNTKIHILPTINPDGYANASNTCDGVEGRYVTSSVSNAVDLNRNFPDYFFRDPDLVSSNESLAVIRWMNNTKFILSAALHEGAMVANYPYDFNPDDDETGFITPDDDVFQYLANIYSKNHPQMHKDIKCPQSDKYFEDGITNGADWYRFFGGMGDYNYNYHGCMELTLELNCCKYPSANDLPKLWDQNKKSLLLYCMQANRGVTGIVLDFITRKPIQAKLKIVGRDKVEYRKGEREIYFESFSKTGEFWRLLLPGHYTLKVEKVGYYTEYKNFTVKDAQPFPKLTNITVRLINSSTPTTTSTTTKKPTTTAKVPNLQPRTGEESETTMKNKIAEVAELSRGCANCNKFFLVLGIVAVFLILIRGNN